MITYFNKGTIWKGSDCEILVTLLPCYAAVDFEEVENFAVNFYTTSPGVSIQKGLEDFSITGNTGLVHFQYQELDTLDDGALRYLVEYAYEGSNTTFSFCSNFYLKSPAAYTAQTFVTEENVEQIVAEQIAQISGVTTGVVSDMIASALTDYATTAVTNTKINKPAANKGSAVQPVYVTRDGEFNITKVSSAASSRWNSLVLTNVNGTTFLGKNLQLCQMTSGGTGNVSLTKPDTVGGFAITYPVTGEETYELNENQHFVVDSDDLAHIREITQSDYDSLVSGGTVDQRTLYIVKG